MADIFRETALPLVLVFEGSKFTNNPADNGGPTRYGVIQKEYDSYRQKNNKPIQSVNNIEMPEVEDIYFNEYWITAKCDQMEEKLSVAAFDTSVNNGCGRCVKLIQQTIGAKVDGVIGPETLSKLKTYDQMVIANKFMDQREIFYNNIVKNNPTQQVFLKGWLRRLNFLRDYVNGVKTLDQIKKIW